MDLYGYEAWEITEHSALSPVITVDDSGLSVQRTYKIAWDDMPEAIATYKGYSTVADGNYISRALPIQDPDFSELRCARIRVQGIDWASSEAGLGTSGTDANVYDWAKLIIDFERPKYFIRPDDEIGFTTLGNEFRRYCEVRSNAEGDYLSVKDQLGLLRFPGTSLDPDTTAELETTLGSDQINAPLKQLPGKIIGQGSVTVLWRQVPYSLLPLTHITEAIGRINKGPFGDPDDDTRYWPEAWTLLLTGAEWNDPYTMANGDWAWDIKYTFKYKQNRFNFYFNPKALVKDWYQVTNSGIYYRPGTDALPDGYSVYDEYDFKKLFSVNDS